MSFGPRPAVELAPPVVAVLMRSAPARTISRTFARMPSAPSATPHGRPESGPVGGAIAERAEAVAHAARRRDEAQSDLKSRTGDQALRRRPCGNPASKPSGISDGCVPGLKGLFQDRRDSQVPRRLLASR